MVRVPAKFRENTSMRFRGTVRKLNVTDGRTDRQTDRIGRIKSKSLKKHHQTCVEKLAQKFLLFSRKTQTNFGAIN